MKDDTQLEFMCPYCGAVNEFAMQTLRDMYKEQVETCGCCKKPLGLIAADGVEGSINLIITELESNTQLK